MKPRLLSLLLVFALSCSTQKKTTSTLPAPATSSGKREMINLNTFLITIPAEDDKYGYTKENPVMVGGARESEGPLNERRYLNGLLGPEGEELDYHRVGSCCPFETPNGFMGGGMLDKYKVYWEGVKDTPILYINMYDMGELKIPKGFTARK